MKGNILKNGKEKILIIIILLLVLIFLSLILNHKNNELYEYYDLKGNYGTSNKCKNNIREQQGVANNLAILYDNQKMNYNRCLKENKELKNELKQKDSQLFEIEGELEKLGKKYRNLIAKIGGTIASKNKLEVKVKDLELKLKESMSDKYLVRKLPAQKPKIQKITKLKNHVVNSQAKTILKNKNEMEEENV